MTRPATTHQLLSALAKLRQTLDTDLFNLVVSEHVARWLSVCEAHVNRQVDPEDGSVLRQLDESIFRFAATQHHVGPHAIRSSYYKIQRQLPRELRCPKRIRRRRLRRRTRVRLQRAR